MRFIKALARNPLATTRSYLFLIKCKMLRIIPPLNQEDYDKHWGHTSFKGKTVLDIGADYGSTAYYFLKHGAKRVVAVEGDKRFISKLRKNYGRSQNVTCVNKWVSCARDIEVLVRKFKPDIIKVDIEGSESHILGVSPTVLCSVPEWLIEVHSKDLFLKLDNLFTSHGFNTERHYPILPHRVIYAYRRKET